MATDPRVCLNPHCETDDPVRSFLNPWYCSGACEYAHKLLLAVGPPRREDVVRVPAQEDYARVADSYRRLWADVQAAGPQIVPSQPPPRLLVKEVEPLPEPYKSLVVSTRTVFMPPSPGLFARLRKRWLG